MSLTKLDFLDLIVSGEFHALQKKEDRNRDDICIKAEDGSPAAIDNYPYRTNQIPTYIFDAFVRKGLLHQDGTDERGGTIFRATEKARRPQPHRRAPSEQQ